MANSLQVRQEPQDPYQILERYKRRYERARGISYLWWPLMEASYHYCVPGRDLFYYPNQVQGAQKNIKVYDTTQVAATTAFVSKVQRALTPPQQIWAYLEAGEEIPEDQQEELNLQLQKATDVIFGYIRSSNFDLAINECYYDLAVGTAVLVINEGDDDMPLLFGSIPLDQVAIEESINHRIETCFRTWKEVRIADIESLWPKAKLTDTMKQQLKEDPAALCKNLIEGMVFEVTDKITPFRYVLWNNDDLMLNEYHESPEFIIFRWSKINNEVFGRGPIINALPSILSLQTAAYFEMTSANLNICKPYMAYSDGVFNPWTFRMAPNTVIPVAPNTNGQFPIQPLPDVANPAFMQLTSADLRMQINKLMFADPLGSITETPTKTATEISIRQNNLAEEIGPIFTRLQQEFLQRVIQRIIYILQKKGLLPRITINGRAITLKYKSPLTVSQGQQDVQVFLQYQQIMQNLMGPEAALVYLDTVKVPTWIANKLGVDPSLLNSEEKMTAFFEARKLEQQQLAVQGAIESGQSAAAA
jgi:hypothetical protein